MSQRWIVVNKTIKEKMVTAMLKAKGLPVKGTCVADCIVNEAKNMAQAALDVVCAELESTDMVRLAARASATAQDDDFDIPERVRKAVLQNVDDGLFDTEAKAALEVIVNKLKG